jgi:hypothetical protein
VLDFVSLILKITAPVAIKTVRNIAGAHDGNSGITPFSFVFISQKSFSPWPKE